MHNSELTDFDLYKKRSPKRFFLYQFRALDSLFYKNLFTALKDGIYWNLLECKKAYARGDSLRNVAVKGLNGCTLPTKT